jgi:hypothetical protein
MVGISNGRERKVDSLLVDGDLLLGVQGVFGGELGRALFGELTRFLRLCWGLGSVRCL